MGITAQLVATIKADFAPELAPVKILEYLERAQNAMVNGDCANNVWLNRADTVFPYPLLKTTDGVLEYEISSTNLVDSAGAAVTVAQHGDNGSSYNQRVRRVNAVFVEDTVTSRLGSQILGDRFVPHGYNPNFGNVARNRAFVQVSVQTYDGGDVNGNARVVFFDNPGNSDGKYFVEFYPYAVPLTTASTPLSVDGNRWKQALIDGAVGFYEDAINGESSRLKKFEEKWLREYRAYGNARVITKSSNHCARRKFG